MFLLVTSLALFATVLAGPAPQLQSQPNQANSRDAASRILRQSQEVNPDGSYEWLYETENGIAAQEQGALKTIGNEQGIAAQGSFQYTSPEGIPISLTYIADENGFQPQGAHLPTPPPIPPQIARALEWIAAHPDLESQSQ